MKLIDNIRLGRKLTGSFLLVAVNIIIIGLTSLIGMKSLNDGMATMYEDRLVPIQNLDETYAALYRIRGNVYKGILIPEERGKIDQEITACIEATNKRINAYKATALMEEEKKGLVVFEEAWVTYLKEVENTWALVKAGDEKAAINAVREGGTASIARKAIDKALLRLCEVNVLEAEKLHTHAEKRYSKVATFLALLSLFSVVFAVLIGIVLTRSITRPLGKGVAMMQELGKGHLSSRLHMGRKDEVGVLTHTMDQFADDLQNIVVGTMKKIAAGDLSTDAVAKDNQDEIAPALKAMTESLRGLVNETKNLTTAAMEGKLSIRGDAAKFQGGYRDIVKGINDTIDALMGPMNETAAILASVAERDLSVRAKGDYQGDYARIAAALNKAVANLDQGLQQVAVGAEEVALASAQISNGSQNMAQGASEQASSLEEVSSSLQELSSMTRQNVATAKEAKNLTEGTRLAASKGVESMNRLSAAIGLIKSSSDDTAKIVKTIDEIAFQTNLLALNAAVEAARAGDAGKGFAVVAEEVRNLAMRSAEAAKNTALLIEEAVKNADSGVSLNEDVLKNLQAINGHIDKVGEMMAEIVAASEQQSQGIDQINTAIEQMNQVTQQNAANSEESASAAEELSSQAEEMRSMVNSFKLTQLNTNRPAGRGERQASQANFYPAAANPLAKTREVASHKRDRRIQEVKKSAAELIPFDEGLGGESSQEEGNLVLRKF